MIKVKSKLTKKEEQEVSNLLHDLVDYHGDFYITRNNLRLFIRENPHVLFKCLSAGDKIAFDENGWALIIGFSDKSPRKYVKVLAKDAKSASDLLRVLLDWNYYHMELFAKVKRRNPLSKVLKNKGFRFIAGRGKEVLLKKSKREEKNGRQNNKPNKSTDRRPE